MQPTGPGVDRSLRVVQLPASDGCVDPLSDALAETGASVRLVSRPEPDEIESALDATVDCVVVPYDASGVDAARIVDTVETCRSGLPVAVVSAGHADDAIGLAAERRATLHVATDVLETAPRKVADRLTTAAARYRDRRRGTRHDRVTDLVYRIDQRLVDTEGRTEIERVVCDEIARTDPYPFAWIGTVEDDEVVPRAAAGVDDDYLSEVTIRADDTPRGRGPAGRALRANEVVVSDEIQSDPDFEPWAAAAAERGFESVAAVPLSHEAETVGLLVVYADRPYAFEGRERQLLGQLRNAVSRAIHERGLEAELWEFRRMVARADEAMVLTDEHGAVTYVNEAFERLTGCDGRTAVGTQLWNLDVETVGDAATAFAASARAGEPWEGRLTLEQDGDERVVSLTAVPLRGGEGSRYVGVGRDVTERETYRDRLAAQRDRLRLLNRLLRHDIRNDAQFVLSLPDLVEPHVGDDEIQSYLDQIVDRGEHIVDLTRSAGELAESVSDDRPTEVGATAVDEVLDEEVASLREHDGVTVERTAPETTPPVRAGAMLGSVFRNLLHNAVQHSHDDEVAVSVTTHVDEETVTVRVADDGPGVPDELKSSLFGRGETDGPGAGSGVGLFLVETLVEDYGGDVSVADNDPEGAVFVVELPRADRDDGA